MRMGWTKSRYSPIAVDFGADSIKLLQITLSDPPQLVTAAAAVVPEQARTDSALRQSFVAEALKHLLRSHSFRGHRAICSIPAYQTLIQPLQLARSDGEDVTGLIETHLRERLNVDPRRMVIRHCVVPADGDEERTNQEVICMAASRETVIGYLETARRLKLDVVGMHCEPTAVVQAFGYLYRRDNDEPRTTCFVDIGAATTKAIIVHGGQMVFAKAIHAAGDHLTRDRAARDGISFTDARAARLAEAGGADDPNGDGAGSPDEAPVEAFAVSAAADHSGSVERGVAGFETEAAAASPAVPTAAPAARTAPAATEGDTFECLLDELQLCVRYHRSMFPDRPIEKIVFLGGESRHVSTCQRIARALRIGAQLGDPLARLVRLNQTSPADGVDLRQPQPGWAVPMGLCLSEANM